MKLKIAFVNLLSTPLDNILGRFNNKDLVIQEIVMPLGLMYLSSYLKAHSSAEVVGIIDYPMEEGRLVESENLDAFIESTARNAISSPPDILAFSLNLSTSHHFFLMCSKILRSVWPQATIVVGGVHATNYTRQLLETGLVDFVFRGEGEVALARFVEQVAEGTSVKVRGVYAPTDDVAAPNPSLDLCDMVDDLDSLPFPDWDLIDTERYVLGITRFPKKHGDAPHRMAEIFTSRGCPFRCTFCSSHTVHGRRVRFRSVGNIVSEVRALFDRYGVTTFFPEDDGFNVNKARTLELLSSLRALKIPGFEMQFPNGLSVASTDEEVVDSLIATGMRMATLAIESGSPHVQKNIIQKNCNLDKAKRLVAFIRSRGIRVRCYFILGFPHETREMMAETENYVRELGADWYDFFVATPLVGSEMYDEFLKEGLISDDPSVWRSGYFWKRTFDTPEITADDLNRFAYYLNLKYNFVENVNRVSGRYEEAVDLYEGVLKKYPYLVVGWYCLAECFRSMELPERQKDAVETMRRLIRDDKRAAEMFRQYGDLMPNFSEVD